MEEIKLLSLEVINEIAAGEVIEKPSAVVKELIENSIDAKSKRIDVNIVSGGIRKILVVDDGIGINDRYIEKSILRHATSKMNNNTLNNIKSLGFRGEALYAIANASNLSIISRTKNMNTARKLEVSFGEIKKNSPHKGNIGTIICVEELFKRLPVRKKFLKSERAEALAIKNLIKKISLAYPNISFSFSEEGKDKLFLIGKDDTDSERLRVKEIIGKDFLDSSIFIKKDYSNFSFRLYASIPTYNKANWQNSAIIINGRLIKDKAILGVLKAAYAGLLAGNRYPVIILYVKINPKILDINVHPSKTEIRILNRTEINSSLIKMIRSELEKLGLRYSIDSQRALLNSFQNVNKENNKQEIINLPENTVIKKNSSININQEGNADNKYRLGLARAQINNMFIVSQTENSIILIDQHAAHERIVLESLKKDYFNNKVSRQVLLVPEILNVEEDIDLLFTRKKEIYSLGFIFDDYGDNSIIVREIPAILGKINIKILFEDLLENIKEVGIINPMNTSIEKILSSIACHNSIRAGKKLNIEEMNAMLRLMEKTPNSGQCNHGRPTFIELGLKDVEGLFGRI